MPRNDANIAGRLTDFFHRQIAVLDEMRLDLPAIEATLKELGPAAVSDLHKTRDATLATLAREFQLLKREWDDTQGLTPDEKARIEALSGKVKTLIAEVQPMLAQSVDAAREQMTAIEKSLAELRKGTRVNRAYDPHSNRQGSGLDKQG